MIYGPNNCQGGTLVFDVDHRERLDQVLSVNTESGVVVCCHKPIRVVDGEVAHYTVKFRSIYAIRGLDRLPGLFHCYGRSGPTPPVAQHPQWPNTPSGQTPPSGAEGVVA